MEEHGVILQSPCHACFSPAATPEIFPENLDAFELYQRASAQTVSLGGGLGPVVPVDLDVKALKILMDLMDVELSEQLNVMDKARSLFHLAQQTDFLKPEYVKMDARESGYDGPIILTMEDRLEV